MKYRTQKRRKKSPSGHHRTTLSCSIFATMRHESTIGKELVKQQYLIHMPHNMANFGPLAAEIGYGVWGTPANFNGFHTLPSLLQWRSSSEANQTLQDVWPSPALVHYICTVRGSCPLTEFYHVQNSLCVQVLRSPMLAALLHGTSATDVSQALQCGTRNGITELSQMAPLIRLGTIMMGIGPRSSSSSNHSGRTLNVYHMVWP